MSAEKRTISAQEELIQRAEARAAELGYPNFSRYIQALMEADVHYAGTESDIMHNRPLGRVSRPHAAPTHTTTETRTIHAGQSHERRPPSPPKKSPRSS